MAGGCRRGDSLLPFLQCVAYGTKDCFGSGLAFHLVATLISQTSQLKCLVVRNFLVQVSCLEVKILIFGGKVTFIRQMLANFPIFQNPICASRKAREGALFLYGKGLGRKGSIIFKTRGGKIKEGRWFGVLKNQTDKFSSVS